MKNKLPTIIEGAVIVALGILIAIYGGGSVIDIYFGIIALVSGVALLILALVGISQKKPLLVNSLVLGCALIFIGSFLFTDLLSFAVLINLLVIALMGAGAGLVLASIYSLTKRMFVTGVSQALVGVLLIVFTALFLTVNDFRTAFWIIIGILIAVFGVLVIVSALVEKKK